MIEKREQMRKIFIDTVVDNALLRMYGAGEESSHAGIPDFCKDFIASSVANHIDLEAVPSAVVFRHDRPRLDYRRLRRHIRRVGASKVSALLWCE